MVALSLCTSHTRPNASTASPSPTNQRSSSHSLMPSPVCASLLCGRGRAAAAAGGGVMRARGRQGGAAAAPAQRAGVSRRQRQRRQQQLLRGVRGCRTCLNCFRGPVSAGWRVARPLEGAATDLLGQEGARNPAACLGSGCALPPVSATGQEAAQASTAAADDARALKRAAGKRPRARLIAVWVCADRWDVPGALQVPFTTAAACADVRCPYMRHFRPATPLAGAWHATTK